MPKVEIIGNVINLDPMDGSEPQRTQLSMHIGWDNGLPEAGIQVGIKGVDPETGLARSVGGVFITLDWAAMNRAIKGLREARDGSHGKPE